MRSTEKRHTPCRELSCLLDRVDRRLLDELKAENADLKARESAIKDRETTLKTEISKLTESRDAAVSENIKLQKQLDNAKLIVEDYSKVLGTMQIMGSSQPHIDFTRPPKRMRVE